MNAWLLVVREKSKKMVFHSSFLGGRGEGVVNKMQYGLAEDSELTVASRNVGFAVGIR